jgi:hypothetical protein
MDDALNSSRLVQLDRQRDWTTISDGRRPQQQQYYYL